MLSVLISIFAAFAFANPNAGDYCPINGTHIKSGGPDASSPSRALVCSGTTWVASYSLDSTGSFEFQNSVSFNSSLTPASLSADVDNYSPPGLSNANHLRLSSTGPVSITGLTGGTTGRFLVISNLGTSNITFKDEDVASVGQNRFQLNGDFPLPPSVSSSFLYDGNDSRWILVSRPSGTLGALWTSTANGIYYNSGSVGIGTSTPQAILDVASTSSGFLPPRMTTAQRNAISSPAAGSVVYNTSTSRLNVYGPSSWQELGPLFAGTLSVFTANGTWTKPAGVGSNHQVVVELWGGGGGGRPSGSGGGGGGGAYVQWIGRAGDISASVSVTVGTAGTPGFNGGNSTFGSYVTAFGGGTAGTLATANGGGGGQGLRATGSTAGGPNQGAASNPGGSSYYGGGGPGNSGTARGGDSYFGGGGGGGTLAAGGASVWGGGGGGGTLGGISTFGGSGGGGVGVDGTAPGGGGGPGGSGARGEVRVWIPPQ